MRLGAPLHTSAPTTLYENRPPLACALVRRREWEKKPRRCKPFMGESPVDLYPAAKASKKHTKPLLYRKD